MKMASQVKKAKPDNGSCESAISLLNIQSFHADFLKAVYCDISFYGGDPPLLDIIVNHRENVGEEEEANGFHSGVFKEIAKDVRRALPRVRGTIKKNEMDQFLAQFDDDDRRMYKNHQWGETRAAYIKDLFRLPDAMILRSGGKDHKGNPWFNGIEFCSEPIPFGPSAIRASESPCPGTIWIPTVLHSLVEPDGPQLYNVEAIDAMEFPIQLKEPVEDVECKDFCDLFEHLEPVLVKCKKSGRYFTMFGTNNAGLDELMEEYAGLIAENPAPDLWSTRLAECYRVREWCDLAWNLNSYPVKVHSPVFPLGRILIFTPADILRHPDVQFFFLQDLPAYHTEM